MTTPTPPGDPVTLSPFQCPACKGKRYIELISDEMKDLSGFTYSAISTSIDCDRCLKTGVIWLPSPALQAVQSSPLVPAANLILLQWDVYAWLGFWRNQMPPEAVKSLQDKLGPLMKAPEPGALPKEGA